MQKYKINFLFASADREIEILSKNKINLKNKNDCFNK